MKLGYLMAAAAALAVVHFIPAHAQTRVAKVRLNGAGVVPDAILCQDLATVDLMYRWWAQHAADEMASGLTQGRSARANGVTPPAPLAAYGCIAVPPGTEALVMPGHDPRDPTTPLTVDRPANTVYTGVTFMRDFPR